MVETSQTTMDVEVIVRAVVGKSLRSQDGCTDEIFDAVKQRVAKEASEIVKDKGDVVQMDVIVLLKKQLVDIFQEEKERYENNKNLLNGGEVSFLLSYARKRR